VETLSASRYQARGNWILAKIVPHASHHLRVREERNHRAILIGRSLATEVSGHGLEGNLETARAHGRECRRARWKAPLVGRSCGPLTGAITLDKASLTSSFLQIAPRAVSTIISASAVTILHDGRRSERSIDLGSFAMAGQGAGRYA